MLGIETKEIEPPEGNITVVRVDGKVDGDGVRRLRLVLVNCLRRNNNVVVNLSRLEFISDIGLAVLVERLHQFQLSDRDMTLVALNQATVRRFRLFNVMLLFDVYDNETAAIWEYQQKA